MRPVLSQLLGLSGGGLTGSGESQGTGGENPGAVAQPVSRPQVWGAVERAGSGSPVDKGGTPPVRERDSGPVTRMRPNQSEALGDNPSGVVMEGTVPLADCGTVEIHRCGSDEVDEWIARVTLFSAPTLTIPEMDKVEGAMRRSKGRRKTRAKRVARKAAEKRLAGLSGNRPRCEECTCKGLGHEIINHCTCICSALKDIQVGGGDSEEGVWILSTDELQRGEVEMQIDDIFKDVELPSLSQNDLKRVRKGQLGPIAEKIKKWLKEGIPSHRESLSLNSKEISILGQISLFKLNNQEIIYRFFVKPNGETYLLWFLEGPLLHEIVNHVHETTGHGSSKMVFQIVNRKFYTPNLFREIRDIIGKCPTCLKYNIHKTIREEQSTLLATQSNRILQIDLLGPLPNSGGNKYIVAAVDSWDRRCYLRPVKSTSGQEMGSFLAKLFAEHGTWEFVKIDGKCLSMKGVDKQMLDFLKIGIIRSNYTSRQQGMVERLLQTVLLKILKFLDDHPDLSKWSTILSKVEYTINSIPHSSLNGKSPFEVAFRRPPVLLTPIEIPDGLGNEGGSFRAMTKLADEIRYHALRNLITNKQYNNHVEGLKEGQLVWRKRQCFNRNMSRKLQIKILQAFKVESRIGTGMYRLIDIQTNERLILPSDQLIRTRLTELEMKDILMKLETD